MSSKQVLISTETRATALRERATVLPFPLIIRDGVLCFYVKSLIIMGSFEGLINNNYVSTVAYLTAKELGSLPHNELWYTNNRCQIFPPAVCYY